jgi:hypothetical protein
VSLSCEPLPPDSSLLAVKWYLDGALLKHLPECSYRYLFTVPSIFYRSFIIWKYFFSPVYLQLLVHIFINL